MIHYAISDENAEEFCRMLTEDDPTSLLQDMRKENYLVRIVRTQNELREKIAVFDAGLDDRIVEIYKIFVLAAFQKDNPDFEEIELLYYRDDSKNFLQIIADGKSRGVAEIPDASYEKLCQRYADKIPDIRKDGPYIDRQWALEAMGLDRA